MDDDERNQSHAATLAMGRYASGEASAFAEVYAFVAPRLQAFLLRQTGDSGLADDLRQQTMLKMHRARFQYTRRANLMAWVLVIARRLVIDSARTCRPRPVQLDDTGDELELATRADADELVHVRQMIEHLEDELTRLPESQRVAFELLHRHGLSLAEAAVSLRISVGALKVRIHRVYRALRVAIAELGARPDEIAGRPAQLRNLRAQLARGGPPCPRPGVLRGGHASCEPPAPCSVKMP